MQLPPPKSGQVLFEGRDMAKLSGEELRRTRTAMKMIFQDPISSLNPRRKVEDIIAEGLRIWKVGTPAEQQKKIDDMMLAVGLDPVLQRGRRPHQFSAVSASASRSRARSSPSRSSSSATSRSRRSTSRCRPRS